MAGFGNGRCTVKAPGTQSFPLIIFLPSIAPLYPFPIGLQRTLVILLPRADLMNGLPDAILSCDPDCFICRDPSRRDRNASDIPYGDAQINIPAPNGS